MILLCLAIIGVWDLITAWVLTTVGDLIIDGDSTMVGVLIDGALEEDS